MKNRCQPGFTLKVGWGYNAGMRRRFRFSLKTMLVEVALIAVGLWSLGKVREQPDEVHMLPYTILAGLLFGVAIGNLAGRTPLWIAAAVIVTSKIAAWLTMCVDL